MRRNKQRSRGVSDHFGVGWLYADIFLALMIVGFGSSVVVRQVVPSVSASSPPDTMATTHFSCVEFAVAIPAQIADDSDNNLDAHITNKVNEEITRRGWDLTAANVGFVIVAGGFELYENAGDGDMNARSMRSRLQRVSPLLSGVEMRTAGARSVSINDASVSVGNNGDYALVVYLLHSNEREASCL